MKGNELKCSLDFMSKLETSVFNYILTDFNYLTGMHLYTDKCGYKELQRHEEASKRITYRMTL